MKKQEQVTINDVKKIINDGFKKLVKNLVAETILTREDISLLKNDINSIFLDAIRNMLKKQKDLEKRIEVLERALSFSNKN